MDKLEMRSPDLTDETIEKIRAIVPSCVTEAADERGRLRLMVDFDQLRQELSGRIVEGPQERFTLTWPGKRQAVLAANAPISKTLRPRRGESECFDTTRNLLIEGDNLEALKLLQKSFLERVRMIYIDPPYNTGSDFLYKDDFATSIDAYKVLSRQKDDRGGRLVANPDTNGRFHSDWLTMMYSRLRIARTLLREDGLIFISIGDTEQANLKKLCDEIWGADNFLGCACRVSKKANNQGDYWSPNFDYILTYARDRRLCEVFFGGVNIGAYDQIETDGPRKGEKYQLVRLYMTSLDSMRGCTNQRYYIAAPDGTLLIPPGKTFPADLCDAGQVEPRTGADKVWRWSRESYLAKRQDIVVKRVRSSNLVDSAGNPVTWNVYTKTYLADVIAKSSAKPNGLIEGHINQKSSHELKELGIPFPFAKPSSLIAYLCEVSGMRDDDIVMDFFAGSGSTAHGVMRYNAEHHHRCRSISVQLPEPLQSGDKDQMAGYAFCADLGLPPTIASITKERIRRAGRKLAADRSGTGLDTGFRAFTIDTSNMRETVAAPMATDQASLVARADTIKPDRPDPEDLLFQVMIDWGLDLSLPIRAETTSDKTVLFVNAAPYDLIACFDHGIEESLVEALAGYEPARLVFRDDGFASDAAKINAERIIRRLSPATDIKVV